MFFVFIFQQNSISALGQKSLTARFKSGPFIFFVHQNSMTAHEYGTFPCYLEPVHIILRIMPIMISEEDLLSIIA